jgi:uncharacterized membrane protein
VRLGHRAVVERLFLNSTESKISLQGLLLAGMVVGALVLVDLTVSQASTVIALRRANTSLGFRGLFREALKGARREPSAARPS